MSWQKIFSRKFSACLRFQGINDIGDSNPVFIFWSVRIATEITYRLKVDSFNSRYPVFGKLYNIPKLVVVFIWNNGRYQNNADPFLRAVLQYTSFYIEKVFIED